MHDPLLRVFLFFFFKAVSYYLINGSKLNTKIKGTLKFIPWSIKMYFGLDVNVKEKKDLMNSLLAKYSTAAALNLKHFSPFCRAYYFSLKITIGKVASYMYPHLVFIMSCFKPFYKSFWQVKSFRNWAFCWHLVDATRLRKLSRSDDVLPQKYFPFRKIIAHKFSFSPDVFPAILMALGFKSFTVIVTSKLTPQKNCNWMKHFICHYSNMKQLWWNKDIIPWRNAPINFHLYLTGNIKWCIEDYI